MYNNDPLMEFNKRQKSLADDVYEYLYYMITHQKSNFECGEPIVFTKIAKALNISVTPVREAAQRLERDGLVKSDINKSIRVVNLTQKTLEDLKEVSTLLDGYAIKQAIEKGNREDIIADLDMVLKEQWKSIEENDADKCMICGINFHRVFTKYANNEQLNRALKNIQGLMDISTIKFLKIPGSMELSYYEHKKILDYIKENEIEKAIESIESHISEATLRVENEGEN